MRAAVALTGLALAVAGCGTLQPLEAQEPAPSFQADSAQPASNIEGLLLYFHHIRQIPAADLSREHDAARRAYAHEHSDFNRVRLAMVLSLPRTAVSDNVRALEVLEPLIKNSQAALHGLALLIGTYVQEQRQLDGSVRVTQEKLDELMRAHQQELRRHESIVQEMQRRNESNLQEMQKRHESNVQDMQRKLDQLKSLERSLIEREREGPPKR